VVALLCNYAYFNIDHLEGKFRLYITLRYLPEIFKTVKKYSKSERNKYQNVTTKIRSPLWSPNNLIKNCLNPHLLFRIEGKLDPKVTYPHNYI
jgi:hypothetical protein